MERASELSKVKDRWVKYHLPKNIASKSFLDVGCWGGAFLEEAVFRGADKAVGVDILPSIYVEVRKVKHPDKISFFSLDVLSPNFLALPVFNIVLCAGVLYHVSDPVGFLRRLRMKTSELLVLETAVIKKAKNSPILEYCFGNTFDNNYSNWFLPNKLFLLAIMQEVGFKIKEMFELGGGRLCMHLLPKNKMPSKILPRKVEFMRS